MIFFDYTYPKMIVADKGKHIREKNNTYVDDEGNTIKVEPKYSTTYFVPDDFTEKDMNELYVEENI